MYEDCIWIDFETMDHFMVDVFKGVGVPEDEAKICADVLITSDKRGIDSHGIARLKTIYYDRIRIGIQQPFTHYEIIKEGPTTAVIDGHDGMGHVIGYKSMGKAIEKARAYGMGMVAVRNSTHYGIAGYYALMAVNAGMVGISGTNARPSVAPTFGVENMLGTNALTFGMPSDEEFPFVLDCATSLTQRGKIEVYDREGKTLPAGWVIDHTGKTRTDTHQILDDLVKGTAALTPLGGIGEETAGYKGYGYSTVVEILSAALQGGSFLKMLSGWDKSRQVPHRLGHFFIAIDISAFTELESFKKTTGDILRALRASKKMPEESRIYTAGEKEHMAWLERKDKGVPVNRVLQKEMIIMRDELNLSGYDFPF
ncbi:MAG: Ldh family oxidoreductase [Candidatus Latescibacteria bacterium]|nr:Ldh family oxidoreductase [Candidatus Latescibacterota bacterium]